MSRGRFGDPGVTHPTHPIEGPAFLAASLCSLGPALWLSGFASHAWSGRSSSGRETKATEKLEFRAQGQAVYLQFRGLGCLRSEAQAQGVKDRRHVGA